MISKSSNQTRLNTELNHLETVFTNNNDYRKRVINNIIKSEKEKTNTNNEPTNTSNEPNTKDEPTNTNTETPQTIIILTLPYAGQNEKAYEQNDSKHQRHQNPNYRVCPKKDPL